MSLTDLQQTISQWGRETFGKPDARAIATRMNCEVAELLVALNHIPPAGLDRADALKAIGLECADIQIMLVQVADALGLNLEALTNEKFEVNRGRSWATGPNGKVQHVETIQAPQLPLMTTAEEARDIAYRVLLDQAGVPRPGAGVKTFVEEGSGATMELDKFYILWDSGGLVLPQGFASAEEAVAAATAAGYHIGLAVPRFIGWEKGWEGTDGINVMYGESLYLWWAWNSETRTTREQEA